MFLFVPGLSAAVKCSIIGGACVAVAAAEVLRASSVLESIKTKAGSAFVFTRGAAAKPSEPLSSSQVAPEAPDNDDEIIKASFATEDVVKCDCGNGTFISVPEDQDAVRSSTLHSSAINVKMQALHRLSDEVVVDGDPAAVKMLAPGRLSDKAVVGGDPAAVKMQAPDRLSDEAVVDGDPAATYDGSIREQVSVVGGRRHDPGQHLDSTADVVASVGTACGKVPLMPDLGAESADVKAKAVHLTAIRDRHLDPTVERNGRSWASGVFKGTRDFVRGCIKNAIPWISRVFKEIRDLVKEWILDLKEWILDHQVILKKILLVVADVVAETSPIWKHRPSCKQLLMRIYRLVRSEVRW